jgi:hypothetical protein
MSDREGEAASGRAQLSTSLAEAGVGILLIVGVVSTFALGVPTPETQETQLDAYATDAATVLPGEPPRHQDATRLSEVARDRESFERERDALDRRLDRLLPDNLLYQVETRHGTVGYERPVGVTYGSATTTTAYGDLTIRVWYA